MTQIYFLFDHKFRYSPRYTFAFSFRTTTFSLSHHCYYIYTMVWVEDDWRCCKMGLFLILKFYGLSFTICYKTKIILTICIFEYFQIDLYWGSQFICLWNVTCCFVYRHEDIKWYRDFHSCKSFLFWECIISSRNIVPVNFD